MPKWIVDKVEISPRTGPSVVHDMVEVEGDAINLGVIATARLSDGKTYRGEIVGWRPQGDPPWASEPTGQSINYVLIQEI